MSKTIETEFAYALWRWDMWTLGYGSYNDIEWAIRWHILTPFRRPSKIWGAFVKWVIELHNKANADDLT